MKIPNALVANCEKAADRKAWLASLSLVLRDLKHRWSLRIGPPLKHAKPTCSWVAPAVRADGTSAVLKLAMPHMEARHEIEGLRFWDGEPTARLLEADTDLWALLVERCEPGYPLTHEPEATRDAVIANLLKRLWSRSDSSNDLRRFDHLSKMLECWRNETLAEACKWPDAGLVREGLEMTRHLSTPSSSDRLLATDLHAGNVLRSRRERWLVIDPKPFVGDPVYDLVQHLHTCEQRLHADPMGLVSRVAELADVDPFRLRMWTFARAAADPRLDWSNMLWVDVANALAP